MKSIMLALLFVMGISCKPSKKEMKSQQPALEEAKVTEEAKYPSNLVRVFDAHGGLKTWKAKRVLQYDILKGKMTEKHTIDLNSRNEKITMPGISMGSKGSDIWLHDVADAYKGDPVFYHNLMFYFYAMPFVLADEGIRYSETEPLEYEGKSYPGIRIGYESGVGLSSKDEYFLHYDPNTMKMAWLGYTVTFKTGERSDEVRWIRYNDWMDVDGLLVPKSLTWHAYEGKTIKEAREPLVFENVSFSELAPADGFFDLPEGAEIVN